MIRYFLRKRDVLAPVYECDFEKKTWRLAASRIGVIDGSGGDMPDGGAQFLGEGFEEVWPRAGESGGRVTFVRAAARGKA